MSTTVRVAVGVIYREQRFFITKRSPSAHQGDKWEFPGGKVELNETVVQALARELKEEINIDILACQPLVEISHDYGDKKVLLEVFIVEQFNGEPNAQEGQQQQWSNLTELSALEFPKANKEIIDLLATHHF